MEAIGGAENVVIVRAVGDGEGQTLVSLAGLEKVREACDNLAAFSARRKTHQMASDEMVDKAHKLLSEFLAANGGG